MKPFFIKHLLAATNLPQQLKKSSAIEWHKTKVVPLHAMEALGGRGGIAPTLC
jgi:hypothetical protein